MDELCFAGVDVREHVGGDNAGWAMRRPCDGGNVGPFVNACELYEEATQDEIDKEAALIQEGVDRFEKIFPVIEKIKTDNKGKNIKGSVICPICGEKLHWIHHATNGHVYGRCDTEDCVHWME